MKFCILLNQKLEKNILSFDKCVMTFPAGMCHEGICHNVMTCGHEHMSSVTVNKRKCHTSYSYNVI